jgi:hypothetical protein
MDTNLPPRDLVSDQPKPREPIFGPGAPEAIAYAIGWIGTTAIICWARHR